MHIDNLIGIIGDTMNNLIAMNMTKFGNHEPVY